MGTAKTEGFTKRQNELATLAKALGHPARVAIIEYLVKTGTCICGDIVDKLPLAQATFSQHLKDLKQAGLIKGKIDGNAVCYCVDERTIERITGYLDSIATRLKNSKCC